MCVPEMASPVHVLRWLSLLMIVSSSVNGETMITLTMTTQDVYIFEGQHVVFDCTGVTNSSVTWYKGEEKLNSSNKLEISEGSLIINVSVPSDNGVYSCRYGNTSREVTLQVLTSSWNPRCERSPSTGVLTTGDMYTVTCSSTGLNTTSLQWLVSNVSILDSQTMIKRQGSEAISSYSSTITDSTSSLIFTCEANLGALKGKCHIYIELERVVTEIVVIPFVVVGLMSLIALLLFFVVLYFLFRHRQCRFCREAMQEPNQILDANSLQTGAFIPPPVVAIDMDISEDEESVKNAPHTYSELEPVSQPPDVVPTQEPTNNEQPDNDSPELETPVVQPETSPTVEDAPVAKPPSQPQSKKKNLTITKNMDQKFDKPAGTLEKKAVPVAVLPPASKPRQTRRRQKKVIKHYKEPPVKARMKTPKEPIYAQVKKLNVPFSALTSKAADDTPSTSTGADTGPAQPPSLPPRPSSDSLDSKETSSIATGETDSMDQTPQLENDLGRENSKKKRVRHYRKKSEDNRKNSDQSSIVLNIEAPKKDEPPQEAATSLEESSGTSKKKKKKDKTPADRVIYAELDFSQDVGLNIIE